MNCKTVWKYDVEVADAFDVLMPKGAVPLAADTQGGKPQMWVLVDPDEPVEAVKFRLAGTGHTIREKIKRHVGTFQMYGGSLVLHLFEVE